MSITVTNNEAELAKTAIASGEPAKTEVVEQSVSEQASEETADESETSDDKEVVEVEAKEGDDSEGDEPSEDEPEKVEAKPKKLSGVQKRINKLAGKLSEREQRIADLEEKLSRVLSKEPASESKPTPEAKLEGKPAKPNPDNFETHEAYEQAREKYYEDLADWKVEQKLKDQETKSKESQLKGEFQKQIEDYGAKAKTYAKENPEFQEVVAQADHVQLSVTVQNAILKHGPELAFELAKDVEALEELCKLPAIDAAERIGEIKARLKNPEPKPAPKKVSSAPAPVAPVKGTAKSQPKTLAEAAAAGASEYQKLRMEQMKNKRPSWG